MDCDWSDPDGIHPCCSPRCEDYIAAILGRKANLVANFRRADGLPSSGQ